MKPWEENYETTKKPWEESYSVPPEPETSALEAGAIGIGQGAIFGLGDELAGASRALTGGLSAKDGTLDERGYFGGMKERYQEGREATRAYHKQAQKEHPVAYTAGEIGGAIPSTLLSGGLGVGGKVAQVASKLPGMAKAAQVAAKVPLLTPAIKAAAPAAAEGALFGLGTSTADLTEGEFQEALKDTGIGAGLGGGIGIGANVVGAGIKKGAQVGKKVYDKYFNLGTGDLAVDAAGDILELTPKQRQDAAREYVKTGPGQAPKTVAEELPSYLKEKGGIIQSTKVLKQETSKTLEQSGKEIGDVLTTFDDTINALKAKTIYPEGAVKSGEEAFPYSTIIDAGKLKEAGINPASWFVDKAKQKLAKEFSESVKFKFNDLADNLSKEVEQFRGQPGFDNQVKKVDTYIDQLRKYQSKNTGENFMDSIKEVHEFRKNTDRLIKDFSGAPPEVADSLLQDALIQTRREMSSHLQDNMLGKVKDFAQEMADKKYISPEDFSNLTGLQDRIYKANRNYKLASFVDNQIDRAIGRKDARKLISLTDVILGAGIGAGSGPLGLGVVAAKKAGEFARPRVQLYSQEIAKAAAPAAKRLGAAARVTAVQQATPEGKMEVPQDLSNRFKGTKWANNFSGDPRKNAVAHKILMSKDSEYRKNFLDLED